MQQKIGKNVIARANYVYREAHDQISKSSRTDSATKTTITEYNNISKVNAEPISTLTDPTLSNIGISANKVYLFKTADGKKGLIAITSMTKRTGTIETANGEWVKDTEYYRVVITTKVIA